MAVGEVRAGLGGSEAPCGAGGVLVAGARRGGGFLLGGRAMTMRAGRSDMAIGNAQPRGRSVGGQLVIWFHLMMAGALSNAWAPVLMKPSSPNSIGMVIVSRRVV